jgi:hypothetical protein
MSSSDANMPPTTPEPTAAEQQEVTPSSAATASPSPYVSAEVAVEAPSTATTEDEATSAVAAESSAEPAEPEVFPVCVTTPCGMVIKLQVSRVDAVHDIKQYLYEAKEICYMTSYALFAGKTKLSIGVGVCVCVCVCVVPGSFGMCPSSFPTLIGVWNLCVFVCRVRYLSLTHSLPSPHQTAGLHHTG